MSLLKSIKTGVVVWVWNHTPNCAEMSRLSSRSLDESLSLRLRIQMHLHHLICAWCQRYFRQLHFLHAAAPRLERQAIEPSGRGMSANAKRRIVQTILRAGELRV
jgi:hypothetical protein